MARGLPRQALAGKPLAAFALVAVVSALPAGSNGALTAHVEFAAVDVNKSPSLPPGVLHGVAGRSEHPFSAPTPTEHQQTNLSPAQRHPLAYGIMMPLKHRERM
jgi:hypothetical protein